MISSQHLYPTRSFNPDVEGEYEPAKTAAGAAGYPINHVLRAMLRWFKRDPQRALEVLGDDLKDIANETVKGRPRAAKSK